MTQSNSSAGARRTSSVTRRLHGTLIAACAATTLAACASQGELPTSTAARSTLSNELSWNEMTLGPGDLVRVGVHGRPELSTPTNANPSGTRVGADGALSLPLAGDVRVAGLTIDAARTAITAAYARYLKNPRVDVNVVEWSSRRFYLFGEVTRPGAYVIDRPMNLYQALAQGGGFTPRARRTEVVLLRGTPDDLEVLVFDGETPERSGFSAVRPDDFVFVRRSGAGAFSDEVLPYLTGIGSTLSSVATAILIEDRISD